MVFLVVHLKRFSHDGKKLYRKVVIDEYLEMAGQNFVLHSVILHSGNELFGHNFVLHRTESKQWIKLDDEHVNKNVTHDSANEQLADCAYICLFKACDATESKEKKHNGDKSNQRGDGANGQRDLVNYNDL